jgi:hypothetical protein
MFRIDRISRHAPCGRFRAERGKTLADFYAVQQRRHPEGLR